MGQDMVIYRPDNGVGTVKSKVGFMHAPHTHAFLAAFTGNLAMLCCGARSPKSAQCLSILSLISSFKYLV